MPLGPDASPERPALLVVEDDDDLREAMCELLSSSAVEAIGVSTGEQAVYWLMLQPPPLAIVLDLRLPVINGWDLLAWLRAEPGCVAVPVVIVSGAPLERLELALVHGPAAWLRKPVDPRALVKVVDGLCA